MGTPFLLVTIFFINLAFEGSPESVKAFNYTQTLDHFGRYEELHNATFQQLYVINDAFWGGGQARAPIFVVMGARDPFGCYSSGIPAYGILDRCASEFQAMIVCIEHRFFGTSIPLGSLEQAMAHHHVRSRLTVEQALQDFAVIIQSLKFNYSAQLSPVIVVGMGYGGALAVWFRMKYPKIAVGALASSTPLYLYGNTTQHNGYCSIASQFFEDINSKCYDIIRESWKYIDDIASHPDGLAKLNSDFKTCSPLNSSEHLKEALAQEYLVFVNSGSDAWVKVMCNEIVMHGITEGLTRTLTDSIDNCSLSAYHFLFSPFEPYSDDYTTAWEWLRCRQLIYPIGCNNHTMFPTKLFDMEEFERSCRERFGMVTQPRTPLSFYGSRGVVGSLVESEGNIIFSNGLRDPLSAGSILEDLSETVIAISTIKGTKLDEPFWLTKQKEEEMKNIRQWIFDSNRISKGTDRIGCIVVFWLEILIFVVNLYF